MWNVFEQPWTLLAAAGIAFLVVMTLRAVFPDRQRPWQLAIPAFLAIAALALDLAVATDREKVERLVRETLKAGQNEDLRALGSVLAEDYRDSYHRDRQHLIERARTGLTQSPIASVKVISRDIERLDPPNASVALFVMTVFEPNSLVAQTYKPALFAGLRFSLVKPSNGRGLIKSIELVEIDKQPTSWSHVSLQF